MCGNNCKFENGEWRSEFLNYDRSPTVYLRRNWIDALPGIFAGPPSEVSCDAECSILLIAKNARPQELERIMDDAAGGVSSIRQVQLVLGPLSSNGQLKAATRELVLAILGDTWAPMFVLKKHFNRGRPHRCCPSLDSMFPQGHSYYPGHPAYPSGHATQAFALAYVYATMFPTLSQDLIHAAQGVALRREIAGLHYPSDSLAGQLLASMLVDQWLEDGEFRRLVSRARVEWP